MKQESGNETTKTKRTRRTSTNKKKISPNSWTKFPETYSEVVSGGKWSPYRHLVYALDIIAPLVVAGGARIIVNMPPRVGKTETMSIYFPSWYLSQFPANQVILTGYGDDLARDWGLKIRDIAYNSLDSGMRIREDSQARNRFLTPDGGGLRTAGIGGSIVGHGGNLLIVDDPIKNWREAHSRTYQRNLVEWFKSAFYTRLEPNGSIVVNMTRWTQYDLCQYLIDEHSDDWLVVSLPALALEADPLGRSVGESLVPERFSTEAYQRIKSAVGSAVWGALYQQTPTSESGAILKREWHRSYERLPELEYLIQSWDLAFKDFTSSSYVVGQVWGKIGVNKYLVDQVREHFTFTETLHAIREMTRRHRCRAIYIEDKANGSAAIDSLKGEIAGIIGVNPPDGKEERGFIVSPQFEAGQIFFPVVGKFPWVEDFLDEVFRFPGTRNSDQFDAMTQAIIEMSRTSSNNLAESLASPLSFEGTSAWTGFR